MNTDSVLLPAFAMAALTFCVMTVLATRRLSTLQRKRISPQKVASAAQMAAAIEDTRAADNFRNLFELPVLFYAAVMIAQITGKTGDLVLGLAWAFVATRVVHSIIHCTYNRVVHRFAVYLIGAVCLLSLWLVLAFG